MNTFKRYIAVVSMAALMLLQIQPAFVLADDTPPAPPTAPVAQPTAPPAPTNAVTPPPQPTAPVAQPTAAPSPAPTSAPGDNDNSGNQAGSNNNPTQAQIDAAKAAWEANQKAAADSNSGNYSTTANGNVGNTTVNTGNANNSAT